MYFIYLLRCSDNSLYCGQTKNLKRRIKEHNSNDSKSKYTRARRPVKLVYFEKYKTINKALKREFEIKKMTKGKKEELIINLQNNLNHL
ncbi:MAG: hypothetical protein US48_C0009G0005 [Candidatus Levybacteria bacterium GW2011_GWA2_37_36]|uniref:GIY-YIG domain-containing protein n=1 Tax=Candidatus Roizmanbacteria bacterium GW2011_GWC2_34_23 TaxID=1618484 RepID=A0A0G0AXE1_9BACT|nr:MAG: hypothetical protein UR56_C0008G0028 [Candidatus Roizmanbacteria bacterium GW2011_GWC2_34_23]KKQ33822.1 MAG: hypothetical protein US48_C0009G0005 [Candidatus Levybacteria bacterium GW2011_GWA2_37_36]